MIKQRASGILLHPTSLPSRYGIGDLGASAYAFIDFLAESGQTWWQILPLGPTGYDHSPYTMNYSVFAGNPLLISLDELVQQGLLDEWSLKPKDFLPQPTPEQVDYEGAIALKTQYLNWACGRFKYNHEHQHRNSDFDQFCQTHAKWLDDYALFMALLEAHAGQAWNTWERAIARREPEALKAKTEELRDRVFYYRFLQFQFFKQWSQLRSYANEKDIQIIGDLSIYVCYNSADVWANPQNFQLDPVTLAPLYIAGVPPDAFSATGQLWGNPVYNWDHHKSSGFAWWTDRLRTTLAYVDLVRIDHFRGFESYWRVPAGETTAMKGEWVNAPGASLFETLKTRLGELPLLAEDLGVITPEVEALRDRFNLPGMKILQFAFGQGAENPHLPHNYTYNGVVYPGTHDNDTAIAWWQGLDSNSRHHLAQYIGYDDPSQITDINWVLIRTALSAKANLAIIPLQDLLGLDGTARMNDPSVSAGNWRWRYAASKDLTPELSQKLLKLSHLYGRYWGEMPEPEP
jgi:4-alpha-glucanotransferase